MRGVEHSAIGWHQILAAPVGRSLGHTRRWQPTVNRIAPMFPRSACFSKPPDSNKTPGLLKGHKRAGCAAKRSLLEILLMKLAPRISRIVVKRCYMSVPMLSTGIDATMGCAAWVATAFGWEQPHIESDPRTCHRSRPTKLRLAFASGYIAAEFDPESYFDS